MASFTNWQGIFWLASVFLAILAITLWRCLPTYKSQTNLNYFQLLGSIFKLFATTPVLRTRSLIGALIFAHFGLLWTSMAFYSLLIPLIIPMQLLACLDLSVLREH